MREKMSGINRNYLKELLSSEVVVYKNDLPDFNIRDSGLYILHPIFDLKKITGETYLKVGMTIGQNGLKGRLSAHFSNSLRCVEKKLKSPTVLSRHMYLDKTLCNEFDLDFTNQADRKKFLKEYCYFQVLPLKEYNWNTAEEKRLKRRKLKKIESSQIENVVRSNTRYIDDVIER